MDLRDRLSNAWNAFRNKDPVNQETRTGSGSSDRPDRKRMRSTVSRTIILPILARCAIGVAGIKILHIRQDEEERYVGTIKSGLNSCLTNRANIDQTGRDFIMDVVMSMYDEGVIAILPVDTKTSSNGSVDILSMRTAKILEWFPEHVRLEAYNDHTGRKETLIRHKRSVAILQNPFWSVMNEPNSTLQRLLRKLNLLDAVDEQSGSGKLDLLIKLPYTIKSDARQELADKRKAKIEEQIADSKYGIAYIDGAEQVIQLNRPVENNLMSQVEYLTTVLYSQLGLTQEIMNGSASDAMMINFWNNTLEPTVSCITDGLRTSFLSKTAVSQGQTVMGFRDPFRLVPVKDLAELADKFTRNAIVSSNEIRATIGMKPSSQEGADQLSNKNLNQPDKTVDDKGAKSVENKPDKKQD